MIIITTRLETLRGSFLHRGKEGKGGNIDTIHSHLAMFAMFALHQKGIPDGYLGEGRS